MEAADEIMKLFKKSVSVENKSILSAENVEEQAPTPQNNWLLRWFHNMKNTKKNLKIVKGSPYARLNLALRARYVIVCVLVPFLIYMAWKLISGIRITGFMKTVQILFTIGIMGYLCWKIYLTIPQAKAQLEYYKKYPHLINYTPADTKETIDSIFAKIEQNNNQKGGDVKENGTRTRKEKERKGAASDSAATTA